MVLFVEIVFDIIAGVTAVYHVLKIGAAEQGTVIYDYIFSRKARALEFHTVTDSYRVPYASDHYPVEALFELP